MVVRRRKIKNNFFWGLILILIGFPVLFWNEGRSVSRFHALKEGMAKVVSVSIDKIDPLYEGKLIHVTGLPSTAEILKDEAFSIKVAGIKLKRKVEMFQWKEKKHSKGRDGTSKLSAADYGYQKIWSEDYIDSKKFYVKEGHENKPDVPLKTEQFDAKTVLLGKFQMTTALIDQLTLFQPYQLTSIESTFIFSPRLVTLYNGGIYIGEDPENPQVGDIKINYSWVKPQVISVIAKQSAQMLSPYINEKTNSNIEMVKLGIHSPGQMFETAIQSNQTLTWGLRIFGWLILFLGWRNVFTFVSRTSRHIPLFGSMVRIGTTLIAGIVSLVFAAITITVASLIYRPFFAVVIAFLIGLIFWLIKRTSDQKTKNIRYR